MSKPWSPPGRVVRLLTVAVIAAAAAGCAGSRSAMPQAAGAGVSVAAEAVRGDQIPRPAEASIVVVDGEILTGNTPDGLELDLDGLARLPAVDGTVFDPWAQEDLAFSGVRLSDLVAAATPHAGAETIRIVALDEYVVSFPLADIDDTMILATHVDRAPIEVEDGGPLRLLFLDTSHRLAHPNNWIWSIRTVTVQ